MDLDDAPTADEFLDALHALGVPAALIDGELHFTVPPVGVARDRLFAEALAYIRRRRALH